MTLQSEAGVDWIKSRFDAMTAQEQMDEQMRWEERRVPLAHELSEKDPKLPFVSAIVIAGDLVQMERAKEWVSQGYPAQEALGFVGSYGRLEFGMWAVDEGKMDLDLLLDHLPALWRGADPDDTDPRFLDLWRKAWLRNGKKPVRDGKHLPAGKWLTVYRGQDADAPFGIAWSLDRKVAEKFARGAGTRQSDRGGTVFEMKAPRKEVLAYLTGRNESEVILPTSGMPE